MLSQVQGKRQGPQAGRGEQGQQGTRSGQALPLWGGGGAWQALGRLGWGRPLAATENKEAGVARIFCGAEALWWGWERGRGGRGNCACCPHASSPTQTGPQNQAGGEGLPGPPLCPHSCMAVREESQEMLWTKTHKAHRVGMTEGHRCTLTHTVMSTHPGHYHRVTSPHHTII